MSVTVIERHRDPPPAPPGPVRRGWRAARTLLPFSALGLYAVLRWGTMLQPNPTPRLLGLLGLSIAVAALGLIPNARRRSVAIAAGVIGLILIIPISGLPWEWTTHVRITVTVDAIGQGLSGLPNVLVPYEGINLAVRSVIVMGAGVLLLDGALMLAFAPRSLGELRPAVAALPLVVLAIVPSALARPGVPYLHGVLLFLLLAAMVWGERVRTLGNAACLGIVMLAALGALIAAPVLDPHRALVDFQKLTGRFGAGNGEAFDWNQTYGRLRWPRKDHEVMQVQAPIKAYWKAQDLETFDGSGWTAQPVEEGPALAGVSAANRSRWTQTLHVTFTGMSSQLVIGAGVSAPPSHLHGQALPGESNGTWVAQYPLKPGSSYLIRAYTPQPTPAELAAAGEQYPGQILSAFTTITLPPFADNAGNGSIAVPRMEVSFAPLHSGQPFVQNGNFSEAELGQLMSSSPYGRAYALARRLAVRSPTPYAYALAIERYLQHGYVYDEDPPPARYPIESFLFSSRHGYCQQFAGAMALLLRMGGVPARVSAGFTSGSYEDADHDYSVSDFDAHAWVEAWFPQIGWVTFDPTPGVDPAISGKAPPQPSAGSAGDQPAHGRQALPKGIAQQTLNGRHAVARARHGRAAHHGAGGPLLAALIVAAAVLAAALALLARWVAFGRAAAADPVAELERAFARSSRPLPPGTTLASLEHRFREDRATADYIRTIRMERYAGAEATGASVHDHAGRAALRAQLALGRGPLSGSKALWALPPAPPPWLLGKRRRGH